MNQQMLIGVLLGWLAWRWYSGQGLMPQAGQPLFDGEEYDEEFDVVELDGVEME